MTPIQSTMKMYELTRLFIVIVVLHCTVPVCSITIIGEGSTATERTTDITLRCHVSDVVSDDELVRVTWYAIDKSQRTFTEIFSADLTNDQSAFQFSSEWAGRGTFDSTSFANIRLPSRYVTRTFAGDYRCEVLSLMSRGFDDVNINVLYGPGSSIIITPGGRVEKQEGDELTFTCSAQCNPGCSYRWYKAGRQLSSSEHMILKPLTRDHAGLYACQVRNEAGRSIKPVDLRICFPATILALNISSNVIDGFKINVSKEREMLESSESVVLTCQVKGWPEPTIDWLKSSVYRNTSIVVTSKQEDLEVKSSSFEIKSPTCRDNGEYICKSWNSIGTASLKTAVLNMSCAPFETNNSRNCMTGNEINLIRNMHTIILIRVCFFGNPVPSAILLHLNEENTVTTSYIGIVKCDFEMNHCETSFDVNITTPEQYGAYEVKVSNSYGYFEKRFVVTSQQPPLLPAIFSISNISKNSACFSWKPNFNGGAKQTFSLKIYSSNNRRKLHDNMVQSKQYHIDQDEIRTNRIAELSQYSICVNNLQPSHYYEAILFASNMFGISESSNSLRFRTGSLDNYTIPIPSWLTNVKSNTVTQATGRAIQSLARNIHNQSEQIGQLVLEELTTKIPHSIFNNLLDSNFLKEEDIETDSDDSSENQFLNLFDDYFTLNTLKKNNSSIKWNQSAKNWTNDTYNVHRFYLNYDPAENHEVQSPPIEESNLSTSLGAEVITTTFMYDGPITKHNDGLLSKPMSLSNITISTIFAGAACILAVIIIVGSVTFFKRNNRSQNCKQRCCQRNSLRNPSSISERAQQHLSRNRTSTTSTVPLRAPSITCVYNENASFSPPPQRRPRLSTPDGKSFRAIEKQDLSSYTDASTSQSQLPTIIIENSRASSTSYLELCIDDADLHQLTMDHRLPRHSTALKTENHHLRPQSSSLSYSSHQTSAKSLTDEDTDLSASYLDLYETLTIRSSSQSLSNIYDPLFFDVPTITSTNSNEYTHSADLNQQYGVRKVQHTNSNRLISLSATPEVYTNETAECRLDETNMECVQLRPKHVPPRKNRKSNCLPCHVSVPRDSGAVLDGSYELVDTVSRRRLSSCLYLPMTSKINSNLFICQNSPYDVPELPHNLRNQSKIMYQKNQLCIGYEMPASQHESPHGGDNKYASNIALDIKITDAEKTNINYLDFSKTSYLYPNASFHNVISKSNKNESLHDPSKYRNKKKSKTCTDSVCGVQINRSGMDIHEINGYVQEYTISALARDSYGAILTGTSSVNSSQKVVCQDSNYAEDSYKRSAGRSSPENGRHKRISRKLSHERNSNSRISDVSSGCDSKSKISRKSTSLKDGRDSGVSCNSTNESCKNNLGYSRKSITKISCDSQISNQDVPTINTNHVYEEPLLIENEYDEVL